MLNKYRTRPKGVVVVVVGKHRDKKKKSFSTAKSWRHIVPTPALLPRDVAGKLRAATIKLVPRTTSPEVVKRRGRSRARVFARIEIHVSIRGGRKSGWRRLEDSPFEDGFCVKSFADKQTPAEFLIGSRQVTSPRVPSNWNRSKLFTDKREPRLRHLSGGFRFVKIDSASTGDPSNLGSCVLILLEIILPSPTPSPLVTLI